MVDLILCLDERNKNQEKNRERENSRNSKPSPPLLLPRVHAAMAFLPSIITTKLVVQTNSKKSLIVFNLVSSREEGKRSVSCIVEEHHLCFGKKR